MGVPDAFDAIYSVSDLHLGGAPGFQIFAEGERLAKTLDRLPRDGAEVALVLNGDLVDFLAEPGAVACDPWGCLGKLARIEADPAFRPVFDALARFVRRPGTTLVVTLGNHDVELAFPECRAWLARRLAGDDPAARGRLVFALDGAGWLGRVGGRFAYFVHGNDEDDWNVIDHEGVRRLSAAKLRGARGELPKTNAGTQLVVDVMNPIKERHPFVDVLKPETVPVALVLLALDPGAAKRAPAAVGTWLQKVGTSALRAVGLLSEDGAPPEELTPELATRALLGAAPRAAPRGADPGRSLLDRTEARFQAGERTLSGPRPPGTDAPTEALGSGPLGLPSLRELLARYLSGDRTFDPSAPDEPVRRLDPLVSGGVDVVVAGHTHLRRALRRPSGAGAYLNSGTWAKLLRVAPELLASDEAFAPLRAALASSEASALDPWLTPEPTVAVVERAGGAVTAAICDAGPDGALTDVVRLELGKEAT